MQELIIDMQKEAGDVETHHIVLHDTAAAQILKYTIPTLEDWLQARNISLGRILRSQHSDDEPWDEQRVGECLFDWICPPDSEPRLTFLKRCLAAIHDNSPLVIRFPSWCDDEGYENLEFSRGSWESLWVREWNQSGKKQPSPFLCLNGNLVIVRGVQPKSDGRRLSATERLRVCIVVSNPLQRVMCNGISFAPLRDASRLHEIVLEALSANPFVQTFSVNNPTAAGLAQTLREYTPHIVVYIGHGYRDLSGSGLVLPVDAQSKDFALYSGWRQGEELPPTSLEYVFRGNVEALLDSGTPGSNLLQEDLPRMFIGIACEASSAASGLMAAGIPAVLAMRTAIPASGATGEMTRELFQILSDAAQSQGTIGDVVTQLRDFLCKRDSRIHFSVPVLHLDVADGPLFPTREKLARAEFIRIERNRFSRFNRALPGSRMNDVVHYIMQRITRLQEPATIIEAENRTENREVRAAESLDSQLFDGLLEEYQLVVVSGPAGRGKSSLLRWTTLKRLTILECDAGAPVPLLVPIAELQDYTSLNAYLSARYEANGVVLDWVLEQIKQQNVILLLDALDEATSLLNVIAEKGIVTRTIESFAGTHTRIVITIRDGFYEMFSDAVGGFLERMKGKGPRRARLRVDHFEEKQVQEFVKRFFADAPDLGPRFIDSVTVTDRSRPDNAADAEPSHLLPLVQEPLYLHRLCSQFEEAQKAGREFYAPATEDQLCWMIVEDLLRQRNTTRRDAKDELSFLAELAFHRYFCKQELTESFVEKTATWLAREQYFANPPATVKAWLVNLESWGLLLPRQNQNAYIYTFADHVPVEFFVALHLERYWNPAHDGTPSEKAYITWIQHRDKGLTDTLKGVGDWVSGLLGRPAVYKPRCPNPHCLVSLSHFYDILADAKHQKVLVMLVGMFNDAKREREFVNASRISANIQLKAWSRCQNTHDDIVLTTFALLAGNLEEGLQAIGKARKPANFDVFLCRCTQKIPEKKQSWWTGSEQREARVNPKCVPFLALTRNRKALPLLRTNLKYLLDTQVGTLKQGIEYEPAVQAVKALESLVNERDTDLVAPLMQVAPYLGRSRTSVSDVLLRTGRQDLVDILWTAQFGAPIIAREVAVISLQKMEAKGLAQCLVRLLCDSERAVSLAAATQLESMGRVAVEPLLQSLLVRHKTRNEAGLRELTMKMMTYLATPTQQLNELSKTGGAAGLAGILDIDKIWQEASQSRFDALFAPDVWQCIHGLQHAESRMRNEAINRLTGMSWEKALLPLIGAHMTGNNLTHWIRGQAELTTLQKAYVAVSEKMVADPATFLHKEFWGLVGWGFTQSWFASLVTQADVTHLWYEICWDMFEAEQRLQLQPGRATEGQDYLMREFVVQGLWASQIVEPTPQPENVETSSQMVVGTDGTDA